MAEFKLSRLKYTYVGPWAETTEYNIDDVVTYRNRMYSSLSVHTATDFIADFNSGIWELVTVGTTWQSAWLPDTEYGVGDIVSYNNIVYVCTTTHISVGSFNLANFELLMGSLIWSNIWNFSTAYQIGDIVKYGGIVYVCNTEHTSSVLLENDLAKWDVISSGIEYKGEYTANVHYKLNDVVKSGSSLYICTDAHTGDDALDLNFFDVYVYGDEIVGVWSEASTYQAGDTVIYGGYSYVSKTFNNIGNIPSVSSADWEIFNRSYSWQNDWSNVTNYKVGSVVKRNGSLFVAIQDNVNQDPKDYVVTAIYTATGSSGTTLIVDSTANLSAGMIISGNGFDSGQTITKVIDLTTLLISHAPDSAPVNGDTLTFAGQNLLYWVMIEPGTIWRNFWTTGIEYVIGDIVLRGNGTYKCIQTHTASVLNSPIADTNRDYWIIYTLHDRRNRLTNQGDIVTHNGTTTVNLSYINDLDALISTGTDLTWSQLLTSPNVYYVAPNGIDDPDYGNSWGQPWKTISYACDRARFGKLFPNAADILRSNKEFIVEELINWMAYQAQILNPVFATASYDEEKSRRDARLIIDAVTIDLTRNSNSQTVAMALAYFKYGESTSFFNTGVEDIVPYTIASLNFVKDILLTDIINLTAVTVSYQDLMLVPELDLISQDTTALPAENNSLEKIQELLAIIVDGLSAADSSTLPPPNLGISTTICVKTGTYSEELPIIIPENTAVVGDELRGVVVQPKRIVNTLVDSTFNTNNRFIAYSTENMYDQCPVQFVGDNATARTKLELDRFENDAITLGTTYYVIGSTLTDTTFQVSTTPGGSPVTLAGEIGLMQVFGGDSLTDMFYMRNATGLRNMTLSGLLGTLSELNAQITRRPTGPSYASLDPGTGPNDTSVWITRRSPYVQNVTTFGTGCTGLKIDGNLHAGGNKSIVCNDYTQILADGVGIWCTGPSALCEAVSVFSYYGYAGYISDEGGKIRGTNGNSSYGEIGIIAEGFDSTETPITGSINNRFDQAQVSPGFADSENAGLVQFMFSNAGSNYSTPVTNLLLNSNRFSENTWVDDNTLLQTISSINPFGVENSWILTGVSPIPGNCYTYQTVNIVKSGFSGTGISGSTIVSTGGGASFDITTTADNYVVTLNNPGSNYTNTSVIKINGNVLSGITGVDDIEITVISEVSGAITDFSFTGTVPAGTKQFYTSSLYVKRANAVADEIDLDVAFQGSSTKTSSINFNFLTHIITPSTSDSGFVPTAYGRDILENGWYRIWFTTYDVTSQNTSIKYTIFPRGKNETSGFNYVFGAQLENSDVAGFYLGNGSNKNTAYANFSVKGNGLDLVTVGSEIRSNSVFETRVIDVGTVVGGSNYLESRNNAQTGTSYSITLAGSDENLATSYEGMRVFVNSGVGSGQYGTISSYDAGTREAIVVNDIFEPLQVIGSASSTNKFTLDSAEDANLLYINQPVQFIPKFYSTTVFATSRSEIEATATTGGVINTMTVSTSAPLSLGMPIQFTGEVFGGVIDNFTYFVVDIIDSTTIQVGVSQFGSEIFLNTATGSMQISYPSRNNYLHGSVTSMVPFMPIQFTGAIIGGISAGTIYYINDIDTENSRFSISTTLITGSATATNASNQITVASSAGVTPCTPIIFSGVGFGNVAVNTKYYVSKVININTITISDSLIITSATATTTVTNLISVTDTTGMVVDNPIYFVGNAFGGIISEQLYYITSIDPIENKITVSLSVGGQNINLTSATGVILVRTVSIERTLTNASGTMSFKTVNPRLVLTSATGYMNAVFQSSLFGGISKGTIYYVKTINTGNKEFTLTDAVDGVSTITLTTNVGSMLLAESGWGHVISGTTIESALNPSSLYNVEPKIAYSRPEYSQNAVVLPTQLSSSYSSIKFGNGLFLAVALNSDLLAKSTNGTSWTTTTLVGSAAWSAIGYGNKYWVLIATGSNSAYYSNSNGLSWKPATLPSTTNWSSIAYGSDKFVIIDNTTNSNVAAYSSTYGATWTSSTLPNLAKWVDVTYGKGKFVAISQSDKAAYSTNGGATWITATLPRSDTWSSIAYGNGRFVAVSSTSGKSAYSLDGITWKDSIYTIAATKIEYGQGVFLAVFNSGTVAYSSEDGIYWKQRSVIATAHTDLAFGYTSESHTGVFVTVAGSDIGSTINLGCVAKGRVTIVDGGINKIEHFEPGSGYLTAPTVNLIDPSQTIPAALQVRIGNGALANPEIINPGYGFTVTSTQSSVNGSGYADTYQYGLSLYLNNVSALPRAGDNLTIVGDPIIYKVTEVFHGDGSIAPNISIRITVAPSVELIDAPEHGTSVTIRQKYSQVRLTNHDFLSIGYGDDFDSNYPGFPKVTTLRPQDQTIENNFGRVFYTSSDQDGNFNVGNLFAVQQATGTATLNATAFNLSGLQSLQLGSVTVGAGSATITQFSTDPYFTANSDTVLPTQRAIRSYITSQIGGGQSSLNVNTLTSGVIYIANNTITTTTGASINVKTKMNFTGGIDGAPVALQFFLQR